MLYSKQNDSGLDVITQPYGNMMNNLILQKENHTKFVLLNP